MLSRPLFNLRLDVERCAHAVYVNGGLVRQNLEQIPLHGDFPINHWLRSGSNELKIHLFLWVGEPIECDVSVAIGYRDARSPSSAPLLTLLTLAYEAARAALVDPTRGSSTVGLFDSTTGQLSAQGDLWVGPAALQGLGGRWSQVHVLRRTFSLPLPFPRWAFLDGERQTLEYELQSDEEVQPFHAALLLEYERLRELLSRGEVEAFLDACDERSVETDLAYYKAPGETRAALRQQLILALNDPQLELATLDVEPGEAWTYTVGSQGTLVALTQGNRASAILRFQARDDTPFSVALPLFFRKQHLGYVVTR